MRKLDMGDIGNFEADVLVEEASIITKPERSYATLRIKYDGHTYSAKRWNYDGDLPKARDVIYIQGRVTSHMGNINIIIDNWFPSNKQADDFADKANINVDKYMESIYTAINSIEIPKLKELTFAIISDYEELAQLLPAAVNVHHAYISGWLEHTVEVLRTAIYSANVYNKKGFKYNDSIIIAGAILHDIGKLRAYGLDNGIPVMTTEGQLYDHIALGVMILEEYKNRLNIEDEDMKWFRHLAHVVLSHHGELEYGSPVKPATPEAVVVHISDLLSSRLNAMHKELNEMTEPFQSKKSFLFGTRLYNHTLDTSIE